MRARDIDRKAFSAVHYNIIAGRFKNALEPRMVRDEEGTAGAERNAIIDLAIDMAKRLQLDNAEFDPVRFLNMVSPDPELYPLAELWDGVDQSEWVDDCR
jgi:hypothetical protein